MSMTDLGIKLEGSGYVGLTENVYRHYQRFEVGTGQLVSQLLD
jgi:hypothetical protein